MPEQKVTFEFSKKNNAHERYYISKDNIIIGEAFSNRNNIYDYFYVDKDKYDHIAHYHFKDITESHSIYLPIQNLPFPWIHESSRLQLMYDYQAYGRDYPSVLIDMKFDIGNWSENCSLNNFFTMVNTHSKKFEHIDCDANIEVGELPYYFFTIKINEKSTIDEIYNSAIKEFTDFTTEVIAQLNNDKPSLTDSFHFPRAIKIPCEQYLLYFAQFLADLGIHATTKIETEAQQTLFSIRPEDDNQALEQIRDALDIYLALPQSPEMNTLSPIQQDISVQQLQANLMHLNSQLMLARAMSQTQDASIQSMSLTNYQLLNKLKIAETKHNSAKPLYGSVMKVQEYKGKGFSINLPELLRMLKRRFHHNE